MNKQNFNNEENFWPCVSDMFLAFFVIALALYANCNLEKGRGDEYISSLARKEAESLMRTLHSEHPSIVSPLTEEETQESSVDCPLLAQRLYLLTKKQELLDSYFRLPEKEVLAPYAPRDKEPYNIRQATRLLYIATKWLYEDDMSSQKKLPDVDAPQYHNHLRIVREHIEAVINKKKIKKGELGAYSKTELIKMLHKLQEEYNEMKEKLAKIKQELADLKKEKERLERLVKLSESDKDYITLLLDKIKNLEQTIQNKDKRIEKQGRKIAQLEEQINRDIRKSVMAEVHEIIKNQFPELDNRIDLLNDEGVIRIPESFIGFESAEWEPRPADIKNVNLISDLLGELAIRIIEGTLKIDNISIECHADRRGDRLGKAYLNVGRKSGTINIDNDWLSMMRAWSVWNKMEEHREKDAKLADYRSKNTGLGLFSTSGFGYRVPVKEKPGEDIEDFYSRCRRMDIRLNCSPDKGYEDKEDSNGQ